VTAAERDLWQQRFRLTQQFHERVAEVEEQVDDAVLSMIEVLDSLERLLADAPPEQRTGPLASCEVIAQQLRTAIGRAGGEPIGEPGEPLDLHQHAVVEVRAGIDGETVAQVRRPGYRRGARILRTAEVVVGETHQESAPEGSAERATGRTENTP
jgi:molecular chaperone GrpE